MATKKPAKGLEELLDPPVRDVPQDLDLVDFLPRGYLSVSQASVFLKCPHSWYLRYVDKKQFKTSLRMFEGINIHKAVETVLHEKKETGKNPALEKALDAFADAFEETKPNIEDWEGVDKGQAKDNGVRITKVYHKVALPKAAPVEVEKAFFFTVGEGSSKLPISGRIDSIQVKLEKPEKDFDPEKAQKSARWQRRIHDLKVTSDKWGEGDLRNDLQFATYAHVEGIPDVAVDQIVKGRGKVPNPRYEHMTDIITPKDAAHAVEVLQGVAKSIALGHFPKTDPSNWWCSAKGCNMWSHCRGKKG